MRSADGAAAGGAGEEPDLDARSRAFAAELAAAAPADPARERLATLLSGLLRGLREGLERALSAEARLLSAEEALQRGAAERDACGRRRERDAEGAAHLRESIAATAERARRLRAERRAVGEEIGRLEAARASLRAELRGGGGWTAAQAAEREHLQREIDGLRFARRSKEAGREAVAGAARELRRGVDALHARIEEHHAERSALLARLVRYGEEARRAEEERDARERELHEKGVVCANAGAELEAKLRSLQRLKESFDQEDEQGRLEARMSASISSAESSTQALVRRRSRLLRAIAAAQQRNGLLRHALASKAEEARASEADARSLAAARRGVEEQLGAATVRLDELGEEKQRLDEKASGLRSALSEHRRVNLGREVRLAQGLAHRTSALSRELEILKRRTNADHPARERTACLIRAVRVKIEGLGHHVEAAARSCAAAAATRAQSEGRLRAAAAGAAAAREGLLDANERLRGLEGAAQCAAGW